MKLTFSDSQRSIFLPVVITLFSLLLLAIFFRHYDLRYPFNYGNDAVYIMLLFKSYLQQGSLCVNTLLGAPGVSPLADYPMQLDIGSFLIAKAIFIFIKHFFVAINLFYLLGYVIAALVSFYVFRYFKLSPLFAFVAAELFAFTPYHFHRAEIHYFLCSYFFVPLFFWLAHRCCSVKSLKLIPDFNWVKGLVFLFILILMTSFGSYYAFFGTALIAAVTLITAFEERSPVIFYRGILCALAIFVIFALHLMPNILFWIKHGKEAAAVRAPFEAELYGLKLSTMLSPDFWRGKNLFDPTGDSLGGVFLGLIAAVGFVLLVLSFFLRRQTILGVYQNFIVNSALFCFLLGTVGGLGMLFAMLISPQIRAYDRISIFIVFIALLAFFSFFQQLFKKINLAPKKIFLFALLVLALGLADRHLVRDNNNLPAITALNIDKDFLKKIHQVLPDGSAIFQLPVAFLPEQGQIENLPDYALGLPYIADQGHYRWSYGAFLNRSIYPWQRFVEQLPLEQMLNNLVYAGFSAIYIDTRGYADAGKNLRNKLSNLLNVAPLAGNNGTYLFFNISPYAENLKKKEGLALFTQHMQNFQAKLLIKIGRFKNFDAEETSSNHHWRWASAANASLYLCNDSNITKIVTFSTQLTTPDGANAQAWIKSNLFSKQHINIPGKLSQTIHLTSGCSKVEIETDKNGYSPPPGDRRVLFFGLSDYTLN